MRNEFSLDLDIEALLGTKTDCSCGRIHRCEIDRVVIRNGAVEELPAMTVQYRHILLVSDENTYRVCGARAESLLGERIGACLTYPAKPLLVPNEEAVAQMEALVTKATDLILGVGSGVLNDLCKYVSHAHGLPYFIVATAPSMDGYASAGAAMLFDGMKITTSANPPRAILADPAILKDAPLEMLQAGYGDIIGKYSCLNDWRLSAVVNGEPLCREIYDLTLSTTEAVAGMGGQIFARDEESIAALMRALVVVGIAMAYMGNSRPASGSEHHLSHYFEVVGLLRDEPYFCHGVDVAYSSFITAMLRRMILRIKSPEPQPFDAEAWEREIRRVYRSEKSDVTAEGILAAQKKLGWIFEDKMPVYREKWEEIRAVLADAPAPEAVLGMLLGVGLSMNAFEKLYSAEKIADAIAYAKDLQDRYTVLWLCAQIKY